MKLSIVIPCLNEEKTISLAIESCLKALIKSNLKEFEIIIADNGSTDKSISIVKSFSKIKSVKLLKVPIRGYGAALNAGILAAKNPYILFADADLSYPFDQIPLFLKKMSRSYDLVLGSRFNGNIHKGAMPFLHRYLGTPILTFLIKNIYKINTSDCNSGMRMVKKSFYKKLRMKNSGMEWASELLVKTAINKGKYTEVPIRLEVDQRGRKPHLDSWADGWRHLKVIILLKPSLFLFLASFLILISFISYYLTLDIHISLNILLISEFLVFSYLALKQLEFAITKEENKTSNLISDFPLVSFGFILLIVTLFSIFSNNVSLVLKYFITSQFILYGMWLFFIETIKTHMVNLLPEDIGL